MSIKQRARNWLARKIRIDPGSAPPDLEALTGYRVEPLDRLDPRDVVIVGFPKSGNTWFQHLICGLAYGISARQATHEMINLLAPDIHLRPCFIRLHTPMYFKSHHLPRPEYRRVIHLVRDGRDVAVSYFRHVQRECGDLESIRGLWNHPAATGFGRWDRHVTAWLDNPHDPDLIRVRYEDLLADPHDELKRVLAFCGLECPDAHLDWVINECAFGSLQKKERTIGYRREGLKFHDESQSFFRRGIAGAYKDEMPRDYLREFLAYSADALRRLGYPVDREH